MSETRSAVRLPEGTLYRLSLQTRDAFGPMQLTLEHPAIGVIVLELPERAARELSHTMTFTHGNEFKSVAVLADGSIQMEERIPPKKRRKKSPNTYPFSPIVPLIGGTGGASVGGDE